MILPITILAAIATAYILYNLRSFLRHSKICHLTIETDAEKILFVSDLHISTNLENNRELNVIGEFMRKNNFTLLFILGDLFDDFHIRVPLNEIEKEMKKVVDFLNLPRDTIVYVTFSNSSHDPVIEGETAIKIAYRGVEIVVTNKPLQLNIDNTRIYLLHGDLGVKNGALAYLINKIAQLLGHPYLVERLIKHRLLRIADEYWLIMGHTHTPFINSELKIANTGSWKHYWRNNSNTAIVYDRGELSLINLGNIMSIRYGSNLEKTS